MYTHPYKYKFLLYTYEYPKMDIFLYIFPYNFYNKNFKYHNLLQVYK